MSAAGRVDIGEFAESVKQSRERDGRSSMDAYHQSTETFEQEGLELDQGAYPFTLIKALNRPVQGDAPEVKLTVKSGAQHISLRANRVERTSTGGYKFSLVRSAKKTKSGEIPRLGDTDSSAQIALSIQRGDRTLNRMVGSFDIRRQWDNAARGMSRAQEASFYIDFPVFTAAETGVAVKNRLPIVTLQLWGKMTRPNETTGAVNMFINQALLILEPVAGPSVADQRMSGASTNTDEYRVPYAADSYEKKVPRQALQGKPAYLDEIGISVHGRTRTGARQHGDGTTLHPLKANSQIVFAAAMLHYLAGIIDDKTDKGLEVALDDPDALQRMLPPSIFSALKQLYGDGELPTLCHLLAHTSGLASAANFSPETIDAIFSTKADQADPIEVFAEALLSTQIVGSPGSNYLESSLGYALLAFALPTHDFMDPVKELMEAMKIDQQHYGADLEQGVYGSYAGLSMTTEGFLMFASHRGWTPADWHRQPAETAWSESAWASSLSYLYLLYAKHARFPVGNNAAFCHANLLLAINPQSERKVPSLVAHSGGCTLAIFPTLHSAAVGFCLDKKNPVRSVTSPLHEKISAVVANLERMVTSGSKMDAHDKPQPRLAGIEENVDRDKLEKLTEKLSLESKPRPSETFGIPSGQKLTPVFEDAAREHTVRLSFTEDEAAEMPLTLNLHCGKEHVDTFEVVYDGRDQQLYVVDPLTDLVTDRIYMWTMGSKKDSRVSMAMIGFRGKLYAEPDVVARLGALVDKRSELAMQLHRKHMESKDKSKKLAAMQKYEEKKRKNAEQSDSESDDDSGSSSGDDDDDDSSSSGSDSDTGKQQKQRYFDIGAALKKEHRHRHQRPTEKNGNWPVMYKHASVIASVYAFPVKIAPYETGKLADLIEDK